MRTKYISTLLLLAGLFIVLIVPSCKKENTGGVPYVPVNITININLPEHNALAVPGGWEQITGGSRGILIYRWTNDDFIAYDRHCPYQTEQQCAIAVDSTNTTATDHSCCNTSYLLVNGSVTEGPGSLPLHQYNTTFNGTTLRIYN